MNNLKIIRHSDLCAETLGGKWLVATYLHTLEVFAIQELIRRLEKVSRPTRSHRLNSEQSAAVAQDLVQLRSRLAFHKTRRTAARMAVNKSARAMRRQQPHEGGAPCSP